MEQLKQILQKIFDVSGLSYSVDTDIEANRVSIFIHDESINSYFPKIVFEVEHLVKVIAKNQGIDRINVDFNNYRKERERLIGELAKAAARKAALENTEVVGNVDPGAHLWLVYSGGSSRRADCRWVDRDLDHSSHCHHVAEVPERD